MSNIGKPEVVTQSRVIKFFHEKLKAWLVSRGYSDGIASRAVDALISAANNLQHGLYAANKEIYNLLKYGAKVKESPDDTETTVYFINWDEPGKNDFEIAEEVTIVANNEKRPDLVIYINGIAVAVIELKQSTV